MGFLKPKIPKPPPPPNTPIAADAGVPGQETSGSAALASLISTSTQGLKRRASTQRTSLIGGG